MLFQNPAAHQLPDFPWDLLHPYGEIARAHPDGIIDLSVGTPVDPTPDIIQAALIQRSNAPGYPTTVGLPEFREAARAWFQRRLGVESLSVDHIIPSVGSKEVVAWLPTLLGLSENHIIIIPATAYPTYDVGARLARCEVRTADSPAECEAIRLEAFARGKTIGMVWLNSPSNPTGRVASVNELRAFVAWSREHSILLASDECYIELGWDVQPFSILHPDVAGDSAEGLLAIHSLSKRSNLAGYRVGLVAGDATVVRSILEVRKHAGMIVSTPVQYAAIAAFSDDHHVDEQKARYRNRREVAIAALTQAGFDISHSEAGLYIWASRGEDCWDTVKWLSERGVLVAPGAFYGAAGSQHVRIALTTSDERMNQFPARLLEI